MKLPWTALTPRASARPLVLAAFALGACASTGEDPVPEADEGAETAPVGESELDMERITAALAAQGFDTSDVERVGELVVVGGDMAIEPSTLFDTQDRSSDKGYYHGGLTPPRVTDVCVQLVPGFLAGPGGAEMPFEWAWAFLLAAAEWDAKTDVHMRWAALGDPTCAQVVQLRYTRLYNNDGSRNTVAWARGTLPLGDGKPGPRLDVNRAFMGPNCNGGTGDINSVPLAEKVHVALHEIGHTLGFRHPQDNTWAFALAGLAPEHIAGTAAIAPGNTFNYPSVMHTGVCIGGAGGAGVGALSADDIASANRRFP